MKRCSYWRPIAIEFCIKERHARWSLHSQQTLKHEPFRNTGIGGISISGQHVVTRVRQLLVKIGRNRLIRNGWNRRSCRSRCGRLIDSRHVWSTCFQSRSSIGLPNIFKIILRFIIILQNCKETTCYQISVSFIRSWIESFIWIQAEVFIPLFHCLVPQK